MLPARRLLHVLIVAGTAIGLVLPATAAAAEPSLDEIKSRIAKASAELEDIVEQHNKLREQLKVTDQQVASVAAKLAPLQSQVDAAQSDVGALAADAYKAGDVALVNALLNSGSTEAFLGRAGLLERLAQDRQDKITGFTAAQQRYAAEKQRLDGVRNRQAQQVKQLAARKVKIEKDLAALNKLRREAYGSETESGSAYTGKIPAISGKAGVAVRFAYNAIGKPYAWGADGPGSYDCSGLTSAAWRAAGKSLPHNAAMQWDKVAHISKSQLQPGDLVFYRSLGHVALYVGGGKVIHAPTFGESVKLASYTMMTPYGYGRVR